MTLTFTRMGSALHALADLKHGVVALYVHKANGGAGADVFGLDAAEARQLANQLLDAAKTAEKAVR